MPNARIDRKFIEALISAASACAAASGRQVESRESLSLLPARRQHKYSGRERRCPRTDARPLSPRLQPARLDPSHCLASRGSCKSNATNKSNKTAASEKLPIYVLSVQYNTLSICEAVYYEQLKSTRVRPGRLLGGDPRLLIARLHPAGGQGAPTLRHVRASPVAPALAVSCSRPAARST